MNRSFLFLTIIRTVRMNIANMIRSYYEHEENDGLYQWFSTAVPPSSGASRNENFFFFTFLYQSTLHSIQIFVWFKFELKRLKLAPNSTKYITDISINKPSKILLTCYISWHQIFKLLKRQKMVENHWFIPCSIYCN